MHFRFGDYQKLPHYHVGLSRYYGHLLHMIPKDVTVHLFSDSPGRLSPIAEELRIIGYTVEIFQDSDTLKTLQKFASCQGGSICSNSTFSWWAAVLSDAKEIYAYEPFMKRSVDRNFATFEKNYYYYSMVTTKKKVHENGVVLDLCGYNHHTLYFLQTGFCK
jgi:hypothetical protein